MAENVLHVARARVCVLFGHTLTTMHSIVVAGCPLILELIRYARAIGRTISMKQCCREIMSDETVCSSSVFSRGALAYLLRAGDNSTHLH